jgi:hypothetical protein
MGAENWMLMKAGIVQWSEVVITTRVQYLEEIVDLKAFFR